MIVGTVDEDRLSRIELTIGPSAWSAIVDTGFNAGLELPEDLRSHVKPRFTGRIRSNLAGGQTIMEDNYDVEIVFDGEKRIVQCTFAAGDEVLLGAQVMEQHRLEVDYPARTVIIERKN